MPPTVRRSRHQLAPSSAVLTATTPKNRAHLRPPTSAQRWSADAAHIPELHVAMTLPEAWLPPHLLCSQRQQPTASLLRQKTSDTPTASRQPQSPPSSSPSAVRHCSIDFHERCRLKDEARSVARATATVT
nr:hypothetical protein Itr_chr03CG01900 [Ipomoea trifida]